MLLDAAKKLLAEYRAAWAQEPGTDCVFEGDSAFTKAEDLFYHVVNDRIDYGPETLGDVSRKELLDKILNSQLDLEKTNVRSLLTFALAWSLFGDEQKTKFTRMFTDGDTSEEETWSTIVDYASNRLTGKTDWSLGLSKRLDKHLDSIAGVKWTESTLVLDEFDQEELVDGFEMLEFSLAEAKTRFKYMCATVYTLLTLEQREVLRTAIC